MGMTVPHFCCHFDVIHYLPSQYRALEDCCRERQGVKRAYAYQLIGAVGVVAKFVCMADILPANEAQVSTLTGLDPDQQRKARSLAGPDPDE